MAKPDKKKQKEQAKFFERFMAKFSSTLSCEPKPKPAKKAVPRRKFNIGAKVIHLNELNDEGAPSGELRYIREFRYSEPHGQWRYQLSGKNFLGTHGWILEESVQKYTGKD